MPSEPILDLSQFDFSKVLYTLDDIRRVNPQRHELEQLTAIIHVNEETNTVVGYKDITDREFWIAGHMPGFPLMPGVIQCEAAAQLGGFYARKYDKIGGDYLGFGGMDSVRFRKPIFPNCRLDLVATMTRVKSRRLGQFAFQGFVDGQMMFEGEMLGVTVSRDKDLS